MILYDNDIISKQKLFEFPDYGQKSFERASSSQPVEYMGVDEVWTLPSQRESLVKCGHGSSLSHSHQQSHNHH